MTDAELIGELTAHIARRMFQEKRNMEDAAKMLGYVIALMAEAVPRWYDEESHGDSNR